MTAPQNQDQYLTDTGLPAAEPAEFNPIAGLFRAMRGRWAALSLLGLGLGAALGVVGFSLGSAHYESSAILRIYPREPSVLYASRDDSVLKTYESFVKAETTFVASQPVMARALGALAEHFPEKTAEITPETLARAVEIRRAETLIVLKAGGEDAAFATAVVNAISEAYLDLTREREANHARSRSAELTDREADLAARLRAIGDALLEVGGEFGSDALARAHIEKIAQIDSLSARRSEIEATLVSLTQEAGGAAADMNDQEIMRATLLDRALADLNFEKAKLESELARLRLRYRDGTRQIRDQLDRIAVIDTAMADRRTQIQVLGQTGALTDQSGAGADDSIAEIEALLNKITERLEGARAEARDLNARRLELSYLEAEKDELQRMLDDTRAALDVIAVESGNALPGLVELMVPATVPTEATEDSTKTLAAGGAFGGIMLALFLIGLRAALDSRLRFSDATWKTAHLVPVLGAIRRNQSKDAKGFARRIDRLRNAIMLAPSRTLSVESKGRIVAVTRMADGSAAELSRALAESFARSQARVLVIDADGASATLSEDAGLDSAPGWTETLRGQIIDPGTVGSFDFLPLGNQGKDGEQGVALAEVRRALSKFAACYDVVIVEAGSVTETLSSELVLASSDYAVGLIGPKDKAATVLRRVEQLDTLPRNGGGLVMAGADKRDPALI